MSLKQRNWLIVFMVIVIIAIVALSWTLLKEPKYTGPILEEKYNQHVIVACKGSVAKQEVGRIITTKDQIPNFCMDKCKLNGYEFGVQYDPPISNETLCLCEGKSEYC